MQEIFRYIDEHLNESIAALVELCRLPTVSAQNSAIEETAEHVAGLLEGLGFETRILPKPPGGHPVVDRKSTRLNSSHIQKSRMPSSA